jgi:gamma-glutamylcyclotransferase (GGCT)/AIG2-like uncharacterized protein YtfP
VAIGGRGDHAGIFVYGTLMRGGRHHARFSAEEPTIVEAFTGGRLFHLPAGYPALAPSPSLILHRSSARPAEDALATREAAVRLAGSPPRTPPPGARVFGEWVTVADPAHVLKELDRLELFRPGRASLFCRVLVPVWLEPPDRPVPAWVYVQESPHGTPLLDGRWAG